MCETRFYICEKCGNTVGMIHSSGVPLMCCGQKMAKLEAGTVEASKEKHIPVATVEGNAVKVSVGSVEHPMTPEHYIEWIEMIAEGRKQRQILEIGKPAQTRFPYVKGSKVYSYCNKHGLWSAEVK